VERYRIHADAAVYYLTYLVVGWLSVFVSQASCQIVAESLSFCHRAKELHVNAYVIMPTHGAAAASPPSLGFYFSLGLSSA
jgi:putative transposase